MKVAVSGTPGTGKTTVTDGLTTDLEVIHLNDVIKSEGLTSGYDEDRDTHVTDVDAVADWLDGRSDVIVESHLAHQFSADKVIVLRCHPEEIERRLEERGESDASITENAQSEVLDVILSEAVSIHGRETVYEIDTTDRGPDGVREDVEAVIAGEREPSAGEVSFVEYLDR